MKINLIVFFMILGSLSFSAYKDGIYSAQSSDSYEGWHSVIQISVNKGSVTKIQIEDFNSKGEKRSEKKAENEAMKKKEGFNYTDLVNNFTSQFLKNKDPEKVEYIAGATVVNKIFKNLTKEALKNAEQGKTERTTIDAN